LSKVGGEGSIRTEKIEKTFQRISKKKKQIPPQYLRREGKRRNNTLTAAKNSSSAFETIAHWFLGS